MIRLVCSHCHASLRVPEDAAGTETRCQTCGSPIEVPVSQSSDVLWEESLQAPPVRAPAEPTQPDVEEPAPAPLPARGTARTGLLAFAVVFGVAALAAVVLLLVSRTLRRPDATTAPQPREAAAADPGREAAAAKAAPAQAEPAAPPVFSCRQVRQATDEMERWRGQRVVVTGRLGRRSTTGLTQKKFWDVAEGLGSAGLSDDPGQDQADVVCVFQGLCPAALREGEPARIEGTYRGVIAASGVPLLVDCEMARTK